MSWFEWVWQHIRMIDLTQQSDAKSSWQQQLRRDVEFSETSSSLQKDVIWSLRSISSNLSKDATMTTICDNPSTLCNHNQSILYDNNYVMQWHSDTGEYTQLLLHSLERAAAGVGLHVNAHKTEYMCYNQTGDISTQDRTSLKLVDKFTYLGSSVASTEKDIDTRLTKAWTAIDRLSIIWKSDLTDKMKRSFFQAAVVSILLDGWTTWTLTKRLEKKLDGNYTRMLRAILNKFWWQYPTRHQLYGHLPPITKTTQVRRI